MPGTNFFQVSQRYLRNDYIRPLVIVNLVTVYKHVCSRHHGQSSKQFNTL